MNIVPLLDTDDASPISDVVNKFTRAADPTYAYELYAFDCTLVYALSDDAYDELTAVEIPDDMICYLDQN